MSIVKSTKGMSYTNGGRGVKCEISVTVKGKVLRDSKSMTITDKMSEEVIVRSLQKWKEKTVAALKSGKSLDPENKPQVSWTVGEAIEKTIAHWHKKGRKESTIKTATINLNILKNLLGENTQLHEINDDVIEELIEKLKKGEKCKHANTDGSINRKMSALSVMLKHAHEKGNSGMTSLPDIPRYNENAAERIALSEDMQQNMLQACYDLQEHDMDVFGDLMLFTLLTGLRKANVSELRVNQLRMVGEIPTIRIEAKYFKGGRVHSVPLVDKAYEIWKKHTHKKFGRTHVFTKSNGEHFSGSSILHRFNRVKHLAGYGNMKELVWHSTRYAFISDCFDKKGLHPMQVKQLAGHMDMTTTMGYYSRSEQALKSTFDQLNTPNESAKTDNNVGLKVVK